MILNGSFDLRALDCDTWGSRTGDRGTLVELNDDMNDGGGTSDKDGTDSVVVVVGGGMEKGICSGVCLGDSIGVSISDTESSTSTSLDSLSGLTIEECIAFLMASVHCGFKLS